MITRVLPRESTAVSALIARASRQYEVCSCQRAGHSCCDSGYCCRCGGRPADQVITSFTRVTAHQHDMFSSHHQLPQCALSSHLRSQQAHTSCSHRQLQVHTQTTYHELASAVSDRLRPQHPAIDMIVTLLCMGLPLLQSGVHLAHVLQH